MNNSNNFDPARFFTPLENSRPYLKVGVQGFAGAGKTFTLGLLAIELHKRIGSTKPVVIFDTESSAKFLAPLFRDAGLPTPLLKASRSVVDFQTTVRMCEEGLSDILLTDSMTHLWDSHLDAYKRHGVARRKGTSVANVTDEDARNYRIEIQDWGTIKPAWREKVSKPFVESRVHILMAGRAAWEYEQTMTEREDGSKRKEWNKSGMKMRVEGEMSYEPDLLLSLERMQDMDSGSPITYRECTILKDRSNLLDPNVPYRFPGTRDWREAGANVWRVFSPVVEYLLSGSAGEAAAVAPSDDAEMFANDEERSNRRKAVQVALEEIEGELVARWPGQTAPEKKAKGDALERVFGTRSWTAITMRSLEDLQSGVTTLKGERNPAPDPLAFNDTPRERLERVVRDIGAEPTEETLLGLAQGALGRKLPGVDALNDDEWGIVLESVRMAHTPPA